MYRTCNILTLPLLCCFFLCFCFSALYPCLLRAVRRCPSPPPPAASPNSQGWNQSCAGAEVGSRCKAPCAANATGPGYNATCEPSGNWAVHGNCTPAVVRCSGLPPASQSALSAAWNQSCADAEVGSVCAVGCAVNATGLGYNATCDASGSWLVEGNCTGDSGGRSICWGAIK